MEWSLFLEQNSGLPNADVETQMHKDQLMYFLWYLINVQISISNTVWKDTDQTFRILLY